MSNNKTDNSNNISIIETDLVNELSKLIEQSQQKVIIQNNSVLTMLFWQIGFRINETILQNKRAEYGKRIVPTVSAQLVINNNKASRIMVFKIRYSIFNLFSNL